MTDSTDTKESVAGEAEAGVSEGGVNEEGVNKAGVSESGVSDAGVKGKASRIDRYLLIAIIGVAAAVAVAFGMRFLGQGSDAVTIQYNTGGSTNEGVVDTPLTIVARIPWQARTQNDTLVSVTLELLDEEGKPARFGAKAPASIPLKATTDMTVWQHVGSVPSVPGTYRARLHLKKLFVIEPPQVLEFAEPRLVARAEAGEPLRTGYVLNREDDLWLLSTDFTRQRRLTFFAHEGGVATDPAWSPDGKSVAFTYQPRTPSEDLPRTEIRILSVDDTGAGARQVAAPGTDETLVKPTWSADGKRLFFSVDYLSQAALPPDATFEEYRRIDRLELGTGARQQWALGSQDPAVSGPGGGLFYFGDVAPKRPGDSISQELVYVADPGAPDNPTRRKILVEGHKYPEMYAPSMSPDGKWVVFSAVNEKGFFDPDHGFLDWLLFKSRTAYAHDVPWELYLIPASGGEPAMLTTLNEDQPHAVWLDSSTIAFLGANGIYRLNIDSGGKTSGEVVKLREGLRHGTLAWYGP